MVSKAFPYEVNAFDVLGHLTEATFTKAALDDLVERQNALGEELEEWAKVNTRGKWRRVMLEFGFALKEDAAMFRLRVGDGSRAYSRLASDDAKSRVDSSQRQAQEAVMANKGQSKPSKTAKKPAKKTPAKKAAPKKGMAAK